ncbi:MAG: LamG domain-containing protein, partial [Desulfobacterales bacterium]|nr:LamG domain-containing protein [Desulfobacterales bacterium]
MDGTLIDGTYVTDATRGTVLECDGADDYATTPVAALDMNEDFSVSFWVKMPDVSAVNAILGTDDQKSTLELVGTGSWWAAGSSGALALCGSGHDASNVTPPTPLDDDQWHHVVVTWDRNGLNTDGTTVMYIDGSELSLNGSRRYRANTTASTGGMLGRGYNSDGALTYFTGRLSEVRTYDVILSSGDVSALYSGLPTTTTTTTTGAS